jgi:hypothetical protein
VVAGARIEQAHIVRMACPPKTENVWTILGGNQVLWVNLLEKLLVGSTSRLSDRHVSVNLYSTLPLNNCSPLILKVAMAL